MSVFSKYRWTFWDKFSMNFKIYTYINAGVLPFAIGLSLLISIMSFTFILFGYYQKWQYVAAKIEHELIQNAHSGLQYFLSEFDQFQYNQPQELDLYGNQKDSVILTRVPWGLYDIAVIRAFRGKHQYSFIQLVGQQQNTLQIPSLYLPDENKALAIAGDTYISGTAYLPKAGVKSAFIGKQGYKGSSYIYGNKQFSGPYLPKINPDKLATIRRLTQSPQLYFNEFAQVDQPYWSMSFDGPTELIDLGNFGQVDQTWQGNICLVASQKITISARAHLNEVIISAPEVEIESGFRGNLQIFASDSIIVGQGVELTYPSALCVYNNTGSGAIKLLEKSEVQGTIFIYSPQSFKKLLLHIYPEARIIGQAYAKSYVWLSGEIWGSLYAQRFIMKTAASIFENHLLDAKIDQTLLPSAFVGAAIVENDKSQYYTSIQVLTDQSILNESI